MHDEGGLPFVPKKTTPIRAQKGEQAKEPVIYGFSLKVGRPGVITCCLKGGQHLWTACVFVLPANHVRVTDERERTLVCATLSDLPCAAGHRCWIPNGVGAASGESTLGDDAVTIATQDEDAGGGVV